MEFKKYLSTVALIGAALANQAAKAKDRFLQGATVDTRIASEYLACRAGFVIENEPVMQNYLDVNTRAGTLFWWSNSRLNDKDLTEVDLGYVTPSINSEYFGTNFVFSGFTYPNTKNNWDYWDLEAGINVFTRNLPVNVNVYAASNLDKSGVLRLTGGRQFKIQGIKASLEGALVYSDHYYSRNSAWSHATLKTEVSKEIAKNTTIYAGCILQEALNDFDDKVNDAAMIYGGVCFSIK